MTKYIAEIELRSGLFRVFIEEAAVGDNPSGSHPDWWAEDLPWPPEPEQPAVIEFYPPIHVWPRLPPDHPYNVPPGYSAPDNLPPGHPGEYYPDMPPYAVVHPAPEEPERST